ncbi:MAG: cyclophilin family peptidyl-prolyl cis-trans isomerase [Myxococcota bacterium]|jgi:cyclophilin family peptidyl-prolyl cis-trans isomerase
MQAVAGSGWCAGWLVGVTVALSCVGCARPASYEQVHSDGSEAERIGLIQFLEDRRAGVPQLIRLSSDESPMVRRAAVVALGRVEDERGLPALRRALSDPELSIRLDAAFGIGQLGTSARSPAPEKALLELLDLQGGQSPYPVRAEAWRALGRIGSASVLDRVATLDGPERIDALMATAAIIRRHRLDPQDFPWVRKTIGGSGDELAAGLYIYSRAHPKVPSWVRIRAGRALTDRDATVVELAVRVLQRGMRGAESAVGTALLNPALSGQQRAVLAQGIGRTPGEVSRALLLAALPALVAQVRRQPMSPVIHVLREVIVGLAGHRLTGGRRARLGILRLEMAELPGTGVAHDRRRAWLTCAFSRALGESTGCIGAERIGAMTAAGAKPGEIRALLTSGTPAEKMAVLNALGSSLTVADAKTALSSGDFPVMATAAELAAKSGFPGLESDLKRALAASVAARDWEPAQIILRAFATLAKDTEPLRAALASPNLAYARTGAALLKESAPSRPEPAFDAAAVFVTTPELRAKRFEVELDTGNVVIELHADRASKTVAKLVGLARSGFYDGLTLHRVVPNFVVQGGDPRGDGWGGSEANHRCENNRTRYLSGTVGMALAGKDTGGSQFFVALSPQPHLYGTYPVIGKVVSGLPAIDALIPGDRILTVRVLYE